MFWVSGSDDPVILLETADSYLETITLLLLSDLDMKNRKINVDHQLQRSSKMEYLIEDTKTNAGTRTLPMTDKVYECLYCWF